MKIFKIVLVSVVLLTVFGFAYLRLNGAKKVVDKQLSTINYTNEDYSFSLILPTEFSNYKVIIDKTYESDGAIYINFEIPTTDKTWPNESIPGYGVVFNIRVWNLASWNKLISNCKNEWGPGCSKDEDALAKNQKYVFDVYYEQAGPNDQNFSNVTSKMTAEYLKQNIKAF